MKDHQVIAYPGGKVIADNVTRVSADRIAHLYSLSHPERQVHVKRTSPSLSGEGRPAPLASTASAHAEGRPSADLARHA